MDRIAIFLPNWIGDVVMATPAIRAISERYPLAKLIAVCKPYVADVVAGAPWFSDVLTFDKRNPHANGLFALSAQLRKIGIDTAVLFPNSFRAALAAWLGRAQVIVGYSRYGRGILLSKRFYHQKDDRGRFKPSPIIDDYNQLAVALGAAQPGHRLELYTTPDGEREADAIWGRFGLDHYSRIIGLNPGAAFGAAKHWPVESFAQLARMLAQKLDAAIVVRCGPGEREMADCIAADSRSPNVFSLSNAVMSLAATKSIVRRLDLLITTDSGPRHFAAAFNRPVVTLFGPTHIDWTETYFDRAIHLQKKVPCGPCQMRVCPLDHRCMRELTPAQVFAAAASLLNRFPLALGSEVRRAS